MDTNKSVFQSKFKTDKESNMVKQGWVKKNKIQGSLSIWFRMALSSVANENSGIESN